MVLELLAPGQVLPDRLSLRLTAKLRRLTEVITPNLIALPGTFTTRDSPQHLARAFRVIVVLTWPFLSRLAPRYRNDEGALRHRSNPFWPGIVHVPPLALGHFRQGEIGPYRDIL